MPCHSLNASRTRRSETPATALRSLSVTPWYCTLDAYCTHARTMRTLAGRARGRRAGRGNRIPMRGLRGPDDRFGPTLGCGLRSDTSTRCGCGSMRREGLDAVVLLACTCVRRHCDTVPSNHRSERMIRL